MIWEDEREIVFRRSRRGGVVESSFYYKLLEKRSANYNTLK